MKNSTDTGEITDDLISIGFFQIIKQKSFLSALNFINQTMNENNSFEDGSQSFHHIQTQQLSG